MTDRHGFRIVNVDRVATHSFLGVEARTVRTPDGQDVERIVITHPGAVAIVPVVGEDMILVEQYRASVDQVILEIPAGKLDLSDASADDAARRELLEETGFVAERFTALTDLWTTVGFSNERIAIVLAEGLVPGQAAPDGPEEHEAVVRRIPFLQAVEMVVSGEITDSKSIAGIMIADAHRRSP